MMTEVLNETYTYLDSCYEGDDIEFLKTKLLALSGVKSFSFTLIPGKHLSYENLQELNRRVLMALVDKILIFENHVIEVVFKYGDEIRSAFNYVKKYEDILPKAV